MQADMEIHNAAKFQVPHVRCATGTGARSSLYNPPCWICPSCSGLNWAFIISAAARLREPRRRCDEISCRQESRIVAGSHCKIMLLFVGGDELIESELHHRHMQKVGGFDRKGLTEFAGEIGRGIKHLIIVHLQPREDTGLQPLLEKGQTRLELRSRLCGTPAGPANQGFGLARSAEHPS